MAITVHEAIKRAKVYISDIYSEETLHDLRVEEIERSEDDKEWFITLGYRPQTSSWGPNARELKLIRINSVTGEIIGMKVRAA